MKPVRAKMVVIGVMGFVLTGSSAMAGWNPRNVKKLGEAVGANLQRVPYLTTSLLKSHNGKSPAFKEKVHSIKKKVANQVATNAVRIGRWAIPAGLLSGLVVRTAFADGTAATDTGHMVNGVDWNSASEWVVNHLGGLVPHGENADIHQVSDNSENGGGNNGNSPSPVPFP